MHKANELVGDLLQVWEPYIYVCAYIDLKRIKVVFVGVFCFLLFLS